MKKSPIERAVHIAGSQVALAKAINVSPQRVWNWLNRDDEIPAEAVLPIERATGVPRHELRPDLYPRELLQRNKPLPTSERA